MSYKQQFKYSATCAECGRQEEEYIMPDDMDDQVTINELLKLIGDAWRTAPTSSNTWEVFCSDACQKKVLP